MDSLPLSFELVSAAVKLWLLVANGHVFWWLSERARQRHSRAGRWLALAGMACGFVLLGISGLFRLDQVWLGLPRRPGFWHLLSAVWACGLFAGYFPACAYILWRRKEDRQPIARDTQPGALSRRQVVGGLAQAAVGAPFAVAAYGTFIGRKQFELKEVDLAFPGLPPDLDGLRIAQITDIHAGPYFTPRDLEWVVDMANETRPHLAVVTGDLITAAGDPLEQTLEKLALLKSDAGVLGCLGNHENFARSRRFTQDYGSQLGIDFLRHTNQTLRFGDATLNVGGVDYQSQRRPYLVGAEKLIDPNAFNMLLSHNPDVFPVAAKQGYDLVVGGHTHGGQITVEIVEQWANAGRFLTPYVVGEYRLDRSALYVSRGVGTVNLPMRIGALPEVTLLRLRRV